jgi:hypothetical protein
MTLRELSPAEQFLMAEAWSARDGKLFVRVLEAIHRQRRAEQLANSRLCDAPAFAGICEECGGCKA